LGLFLSPIFKKMLISKLVCQHYCGGERMHYEEDWEEDWREEEEEDENEYWREAW
jgi:hypothetical protein